MMNDIGSTAGKIYEFLRRDNKPQPYTEVKKSVKAESRTLDMAIGWLAREEKITLQQQGASLTIKLK